MISIHRNEHNPTPCSVIYVWNLESARLYIALEECGRRKHFFQVPSVSNLALNEFGHIEMNLPSNYLWLFVKSRKCVQSERNSINSWKIKQARHCFTTFSLFFLYRQYELHWDSFFNMFYLSIYLWTYPSRPIISTSLYIAFTFTQVFDFHAQIAQILWSE